MKQRDKEVNKREKEKKTTTAMTKNEKKIRPPSKNDKIIEIKKKKTNENKAKTLIARQPPPKQQQQQQQENKVDKWASREAPPETLALLKKYLDDQGLQLKGKGWKAILKTRINGKTESNPGNYVEYWLKETRFRSKVAVVKYLKENR